jgi:hypothetical protein
MRPKVESKFGFDEIKALKELFISKGWSTFDEFDPFFENYCKMLENLDEEQSKLIIALTKRFIWLRSVDYYRELKRTLVDLAKFTHLSLDQIHIIPLISKTDREQKKIKSSSHVAYLCQNSEFRYNEILKNSVFRIHNNIETLPKAGTLKKTRNPILLIDDFIGTGDTALEALEEVLEVRKYDADTLYIGSLVCQEKGKRLIEEIGFNVLCPNVVKRGISDEYPEPTVNEMKILMSQIEDILEKDKGFDSSYRFGYKGSEALVALIRTPNNTFPIYWFSSKNGEGKKWKAPFER